MKRLRLHLARRREPGGARTDPQRIQSWGVAPRKSRAKMEVGDRTRTRRFAVGVFCHPLFVRSFVRVFYPTPPAAYTHRQRYNRRPVAATHQRRAAPRTLRRLSQRRPQACQRRGCGCMTHAHIGCSSIASRTCCPPWRCPPHLSLIHI